MNRRHDRQRWRRRRTVWGCLPARGYTQLPQATREHRRANARSLALRAARDHADLLAAEAGIAARAVYPTVSRLVFRLSSDVFGATATLIAAYTADGGLLWHVDTGDEWPDESLITDHLATAAEVLDDYFPTASAAEVSGEDDELYAIDLYGPRGHP